MLKWYRIQNAELQHIACTLHFGEQNEIGILVESLFDLFVAVIPIVHHSVNQHHPIHFYMYSYQSTCIHPPIHFIMPVSLASVSTFKMLSDWYSFYHLDDMGIRRQVTDTLAGVVGQRNEALLQPDGCKRLNPKLRRQRKHSKQHILLSAYEVSMEQSDGEHHRNGRSRSRSPLATQDTKRSGCRLEGSSPLAAQDNHCSGVRLNGRSPIVTQGTESNGCRPNNSSSLAEQGKQSNGCRMKGSSPLTTHDSQRNGCRQNGSSPPFDHDGSNNACRVRGSKKTSNENGFNELRSKMKDQSAIDTFQRGAVLMERNGCTHDTSASTESGTNVFMYMSDATLSPVKPSSPQIFQAENASTQVSIWLKANYTIAFINIVIKLLE